MACTDEGVPITSSLHRHSINTMVILRVTGQNVDKPKRRPPKRRQTKTSTHQNVDKPKRRQTKTSTNGNVDKPKRRQTKTSTNRNVDKPKRRQTKTSTDHNVDRPKRRQTKTSIVQNVDTRKTSADTWKTSAWFLRYINLCPNLDHWIKGMGGQLLQPGPNLTRYSYGMV